MNKKVKMEESVIELKARLKKILVKSMVETFQKLDSLLKQKSEKYDDFILLKARHQCYIHTFAQGGISFRERDDRLNGVQNQLLNFINQIDTKDIFFRDEAFGNEESSLASDDLINPIVSKLRNLISENKIDSVFAELEEYISGNKSRLLNDLTLLKQRWKAVIKSEIQTIKSEEEISQKKIAIIIGLFYLMNKL